LAAYAIPWINGAIKRFITQGRSVVIGERNERGKHMPRASHIAYFGNVMIGDGTIQSDVWMDAVEDVEEDGDDDPGETWVNNLVDHSLESIGGGYSWKRVRRHRPKLITRWKVRQWTYRWGVWRLETVHKKHTLPSELHWRYLSWCNGRWRWKGYLDRESKLFRDEYLGYCRHGVGYLYRDRQTENKCHRDPLPFQPPAVDERRTIRLIDGTPIPLKDLDKHTELAPPDYSRDHSERLKFAERMEQSPFVKKKEHNASQPDWKRPTRKSAWKLASKPEKPVSLTDGLNDYDLWSVPTYRLVRDDKHNVETWVYDGHVHKLPKEMVGEEIVLHKPRKQDLRMYLKPDSPLALLLVLLFWDRALRRKPWRKPTYEEAPLLVAAQ
jgi:hypothetical protein